MLTCEIPSFRQDMETDADIAEEVLRMYGYDHIPSTLMQGVTMPGFRSEKMRFSDRVKAALVGMNLYEILNYSFISPKWMDALGLPDDDPRRDMVALRNPLGEDTSVMRTTLAPSMLSTLAFNLNRGNTEARLFELSKVFVPAKQSGALPEEKSALCIGMAGEHVDFYAIKNVVVWLLAKFGVTAEVCCGRRRLLSSRSQGDAERWRHSGRGAGRNPSRRLSSASTSTAACTLPRSTWKRCAGSKSRSTASSRCRSSPPSRAIWRWW